LISVHGVTKKDSISALREQTTLANTRLHGVFLRYASPASRMMKAARQTVILTAAGLVTIGCASSAPAPRTGPEPERAPVPIVRETPRTPAVAPVRASFAYAPGTVSYVVTSEATIAEIDSAASARTFREVARVSLSIAPAEGGTIVAASGSVEGPAATFPIPTFVDTLSAESLDTATEPEMPICGRDTVPPMHLVTLLPPVPQELREGARWQRRQVYAICQGMIPVRVERTDSYVVTGRAQQIGGGGVTVSRSSSLVYAGAGVEGQHNVRLTGSGSGQASLVLDASAGQLVSVEGESVSEIDITASGRTRRFTQRIVRTVIKP
jgi:hypothetical protein